MEQSIFKLKRKLATPLHEIPFAFRWLLAIHRFFLHILRIGINKNVLRICSSLAFESLFSLVPLSALALWIIDAIGQSSNAKAFANYIGKQMFPSFGPNAITMIRTMASRIKGEYIGTVGVVITILVSIMIFMSVEKAFNEIWRTKTKRNVFLQFAIYWTIASLIPLMGMLVFLRRIDFPVLGSPIVGHFALIFFFFIANKLIPYTRVKLIPAFLGAVFSFILFQIAKTLVSKYFTSKYFGIYGEIGVLFLVLVWIYYMWIVIMFGVASSYVIQRFSYLEEQRITEGRWAVFPNEPVTWRAWTILDFLYQNKQTHDTQEIATTVGESPFFTEQILEKLEQNGLVFKVNEQWGLIIEKASAITMARVLTIFSMSIDYHEGGSVDPWEELSNLLLSVAEDITLENSDEIMKKLTKNTMAKKLTSEFKAQKANKPKQPSEKAKNIE